VSDWMRRLAAHYGRFRSEYPEDQLLIVFDIDGTILDMRHMVRHVRCIGLDLRVCSSTKSAVSDITTSGLPHPHQAPLRR